MNERIQELADQAQQYAEYSTPQGLEWFDTFKEKFAELIALECAGLCLSDRDAECILKHFDVKSN